MVIVNPNDYPWGERAEPQWVYFEWPAACSADEHIGHPACEPGAERLIREAARHHAHIQIVRGPVLTDSGWRLLARVFGPLVAIGALAPAYLHPAVRAVVDRVADRVLEDVPI